MYGKIKIFNWIYETLPLQLFVSFNGHGRNIGRTKGRKEGKNNCSQVRLKKKQQEEEGQEEKMNEYVVWMTTGKILKLVLSKINYGQ